MRLIDADKLEVDEVVRIYLKGVQEHFALFSYPKCEIDKAPTVEAIPGLEKEYLGEIRRAGCMPRSEAVKEIIERWRGETGE